MAQRDVVLTLYDASGGRKVEIFRRDNGTFGFDEYFYHDDPEDPPPHWCQRRNSYAIVDTLDHAVTEVRSRFPWVTATESN